MKHILNIILIFFYTPTSMFILMLAIVYPFVLVHNNHPPYWTCFILYPIAVIIMITQSKVLKWCDKILNYTKL